MKNLSFEERAALELVLANISVEELLVAARDSVENKESLKDKDIANLISLSVTSFLK